MQGKIIKILSNDYTVLSNSQKYICKSRGKFRNQKITPLVGDNVIFDEKNKYILEILERKNSLIRPSVSNIDQAIIITSVKDPDFSTNLLDKLLMIIEYNNITPIICFTKLDLLLKDELDSINKYISYYEKIGYQVLINSDINKVKECLKNKISVFTGQSGAGKSTLLNKIDSNLALKTNEISKALGRGKHTTRHTELLEICDGLVADTPGFSSLDLSLMTNEAIRDNFIEFNIYKEECQYRDCMHDREDKCKVKENVEKEIILKSRYENYLNFIHTEKRNRW